MRRIDLYLQQKMANTYKNTTAENDMVEKVFALYNFALDYKNRIPYASDANLEKWRKAYLGTLNALRKTDGEESGKKSKSLRKLIYELVESKVDNTIPLPKITPRRRDDLDMAEKTEEYLKFELDRMLTEQENDRAERITYVDGTSWYKISWDSLDNGHGRSGDLRVEVLMADQVVPEPGCMDYRQMNYCFEISVLSIARIYDLYGRIMEPTSDNGAVKIISYYYKNDNGIIGRFIFAPDSMQVITWDEDWQIRKVRTCTTCGAIVPQKETCPNCGGTRFKYKNAETETLDEDLYHVYNPYAAGETDDMNASLKEEVFLSKGTEVPFYRIRQLPFVPRPSVSSMDTIYGVSDAFILLDMQDSVNKMLTKMEDKVLKSGSITTKPAKVKMNNADETMKILSVRSAEEAQQIQTKQIQADISQDITGAQLLYESARASSGVTESYQGKIDNTATSGKAKEISAMQSAGRLESLRVMKAAAFAGVYELCLKYLLAFSDEERVFVKILPDGKEEEQTWNKYMFLRKDKYGDIYYTDDFAFSTDPAATLSNNRVQMWQETLQQFTMGTFGNPQDPRVIQLYWSIMSSMGYPLARLVRAGTEEASAHIPPDLEQALMQDPSILQTAAALVNGGGEQRGGARPNSGPDGNGQTHAANVNKTNQKNAAATKRTSTTSSAQMTGGNR